MQPHAALLVTLALGTGMAAAFNPCGIGLLPSYVGFLLGGDGTEAAVTAPGSASREAPPSWLRAVPQGLRVGSAMTVGLLTLFAVVALGFSLVAAWLGPHLETFGVVIGGLLAVWGALMLIWPAKLSLSPRVPYPASGGRRGLVGAYLYGVVFALVSLGCTFPLFLSLLVQATTAGSGPVAIRVVLAYALGMGLIVTGLAVLTRLARTAAQRITRRAIPLLARWMGVFVLASGLLVLGYWLYGI